MEPYTTAQLMSDVMGTVEATMPPIVTIALFLATVNFLFGMLYFALNYLVSKPFR